MMSVILYCKGADEWLLPSKGCRYVHWYNMNLQYPRYHCITPVFLLIDNSDSPSIVEQLQQGCSSDCYTFISDCS